jgi:hypothetical protein
VVTMPLGASIVLRQSQDDEVNAEEGPVKHPCAPMLWIAVAAFAIVIKSTSSLGAEPSVVGVWKVVSYFTEELGTGKRTALLGEHPKGYLIYTPEGRMMVLGMREGRSPAKTDEDRVNLLKTMLAYSGRYSIEGDKVTHHIDMSWNEALTGTDQVRYFKLEGDTLTIKTAPGKNPITGNESVSAVIWERER